MISENNNLNLSKPIPVDEFIYKVLYNPKNGYYIKKNPFGSKGDFITSPIISNLFSEIIGIWITSTWEEIGKPKVFNVVELGPGDGSLAKVLLETFRKFPELNKSLRFYLYEKSTLLKKYQKKKLKNYEVRWLENFKEVTEGPVIFFGNEFFDAIPIKQFIVKNKIMYEKYLSVARNFGIFETFKEARKEDVNTIKSYKTLKNKNFVEYPKLGFNELNKILEKISQLSGGILLIDYGHLNLKNNNTLQAVVKNKKININNLHKYLGKADITYLVNFNLLKEYFLKKRFEIKKVVTQKFFLERMGIMERAKILERKMNYKQKEYMVYTLDRLLNKKLMGDLFKVIFAFKSKTKDYLGFN